MKIREKIDRILEVIVVIVMAVLVVDVVWNVISRYLLNAPSSFSVELARYLLIWVGLLGGAYASGKKEHIAINLYPQRLQKKNPEKRKKLDILINILIILFVFLVFIIGGARLMYIAFKMTQVSATMQIPMGIVYLALPLSGLLIIFYSIHEIMYGLPEHMEEERKTTD